ncbi:MAG: hypothetical protein Q8942_13600 [Bacillota bacterium]|nr:hypothetical protein [Bacillota bacterium]
MSPTWTGEFGIGDIVHVNNEKHRILKLSVHVPNPEATKIKYEVFIGRI